MCRSIRGSDGDKIQALSASSKEALKSLNPCNPIDFLKWAFVISEGVISSDNTSDLDDNSSDKLRTRSVASILAK